MQKPPRKPARQNPFGDNFVREHIHTYRINADFVALSLGNKVPSKERFPQGSQSQLLRYKMLERIEIIRGYINRFANTEQLPIPAYIEDFVNNLNFTIATAVIFKHEMGESPDAARTLSGMAISYSTDVDSLRDSMDGLEFDYSITAFVSSIERSYQQMDKAKK